jgi:hypothetical protein
MSRINKASFNLDNKELKMSMPFSKIDIEKRTVSGWATTDSVDHQDDIVTAEASISAFTNFRNNIREMHDEKKAVGKLISFKQDTFYDPDTNKSYSGIFVSTYVSKGAQDTWEKVLDGTLTGFSIGGSVKDYEDTYDDDLGKSIRIIKEYDLFELSLVDNPANQYANVISIEKGHTGGYLSKALIENVFWCNDDNVVQLSSDSLSSCPRCDKGMSNIGFVETNDAQKTEVVKSILSTVKNDAKEVSKMNNDTVETEPTEDPAEAVVEKSVDSEVKKSEDSEVEKATVVAEEETSEAEMVEEKSMSEEESVDKKDSMEEEKSMSADEKSKDDVLEQTKALSDQIHTTLSNLTDTVKVLNEKVEELNKTVVGVRDDVDIVKNEFGKRVDAVEKDTAFRKSGDLGEVVQEPIFEKAKRSLWDGRFLTKSDLFN